MNPWEYDIDKTIHNYSYTLLSTKYLNRIFDSDEFQDMDTESITLELLSGLRIISFKDHLKRYIFLKADLKNIFHKEFEEISDKDYQNALTISFKFRRAPYTITPSTVRPGNVAKRWLSQECVSRTSVFLIGFGLGMTTDEVSEFLTKVINEEDFNFYDADEVIYWYCYHFQLPYAKANQLKQDFDLIHVDVESDNTDAIYDWQEITSLPDFSNRSEYYLKEYLVLLKKNNPKDHNLADIYHEFIRLYDNACEQIAAFYNRDERRKRFWLPSDITPSDLEKFLCCGIPLSKSGNVKRRSSSLLAKHFSAKRMTRQTFDAIFSGKIKTNRFDLISLNFLVSAIRDCESAPEDRLRIYIDETNAILHRCHMQGLYSANAYECFLLLCLLSEEPLAFYSDVLEYTYEPNLLKD